MNTEPSSVALHRMAKKRYLNYAMSVITSRALPDVRDGLKPVQRRILYTMYHELKLTHEAKHRKSAAVVGEVMGKYHPHGDTSIYEAMVRMAQDFSLRYPLVDGQGNFGSIDGDGAAAMRYTEARMTPLATELLDEIKKETVAFRPTYDAEHEEPLVLPAQVPNLLINGSTGIAVGMSTNIPPHHLGEVLDALIRLIDDRTLTVDDLVGSVIHGPDFPTGCILMTEVEELRDLYRTGSGSVETRSSWTLEQDGKTTSIVVTSIPYMTNKDDLVAKIAEHIVEGKVPQLIDIRDESTDEIRVVLEVKRGSDPDAAMAYLFKHTPLQQKFHVNMTCLVPSQVPDIPTPAKLDLVEILHHFLDFRAEVVTRRLEFDLRVLRARIHILEGFEIIFDALDEALRLIRSSDGKGDANRKLQERFRIDEVQANAILEIRLYRLAKLEINLILAELAEKRREAAGIEALLSNKDALWSLIKDELSAIRSAYADPRRTEVGRKVRDLSYSEEAYIVDEACFIIVSKNAWYRRQKSYNDFQTLRSRDGDEIRWVMPGRTRQTMVAFTNIGKAYTIRISDIPQTSGFGEPLQANFDFSDGERVVGVIVDDARVIQPYVGEQRDLLDDQLPLDPGDGEPQSIAITTTGQAVRFSLTGFLDPSTIKGRQYMRVEGGSEVLNVEPITGVEDVAIATREGRGLIFSVREISFVKGAAKGVRAIQLATGDEVLDFTACKEKRDGLTVETNRGAEVTIKGTKSRFAPTSRGNKGQWIIQRGHLVKSLRPPVEISDAEDEILF